MKMIAQARIGMVTAAAALTLALSAHADGNNQKEHADGNNQKEKGKK
jgi:hypothetical protein